MQEIVRSYLAQIAGCLENRKRLLPDSLCANRQAAAAVAKKMTSVAALSSAPASDEKVAGEAGKPSMDDLGNNQLMMICPTDETIESLFGGDAIDSLHPSSGKSPQRPRFPMLHLSLNCQSILQFHADWKSRRQK
jgi:hypothetical protein